MNYLQLFYHYKGMGAPPICICKCQLRTTLTVREIFSSNNNCEMLLHRGNKE